MKTHHPLAPHPHPPQATRCFGFTPFLPLPAHRAAFPPCTARCQAHTAQLRGCVRCAEHTVLRACQHLKLLGSLRSAVALLLQKCCKYHLCSLDFPFFSLSFYLHFSCHLSSAFPFPIFFPFSFPLSFLLFPFFCPVPLSQFPFPSRFSFLFPLPLPPHSRPFLPSLPHLPLPSPLHLLPAAGSGAERGGGAACHFPFPFLPIPRSAIRLRVRAAAPGPAPQQHRCRHAPGLLARPSAAVSTALPCA